MISQAERLSQIRDLKNFDAWTKQIWYWRTH